MNRAIFLDRDGTIIEDRGYINTTADVCFFDNVFEALLKLQNFYELFIVTNQSGIAKGIITPDEVENVNAHILSILRKKGIIIVDIYVCPHKRQDGCQCMKPKPFFLEKASAIYNIDLRNSFSIGDHPHDAEFAQNVGGKGIFLLTGHGTKHLKEIPQDTIILPDINAAADWIISNKLKAKNIIITPNEI